MFRCANTGASLFLLFEITISPCPSLGASLAAAGEYRETIRIDERDARSVNNLALLLINREQFEEALGPLVRATRIDSSVAVFWNNLAMALERTGYIRAAEDAY